MTFELFRAQIDFRIPLWGIGYGDCMTSTRILAVLAALVTAVFLSACSSPPTDDGHTDHDHGSSESPVVAGPPAGFDAADVAFATNMIPHHQQAVDLAALVPDRSTEPRTDPAGPAGRRSPGTRDRHHEGLPGAVEGEPGRRARRHGRTAHGGHRRWPAWWTRPPWRKLETLKGAAFDTLWLQSMIGHHQGAIEMAKAELANGQNVDAKQLAQNIIDCAAGRDRPDAEDAWEQAMTTESGAHEPTAMRRTRTTTPSGCAASRGRSAASRR